MERFVESIEVLVPKGRTLRIRNGKGSEIGVSEGCAWVTQESDTADKVLEAGDTFRLDRDGLALAYACRATRVVVKATRFGAAFSVTHGAGYREYAASVWNSMMAELFRWIRDRIAARLGSFGSLVSRVG